MLSTLEYAFRKGKKVTTVFRGKKTVWADCEEAQSHFLEAMMSAEGDERDHYSAIYIQLYQRTELLHGLIF